MMLGIHRRPDLVGKILTLLMVTQDKFCDRRNSRLGDRQNLFERASRSEESLGPPQLPGKLGLELLDDFPNRGSVGLQGPFLG